jgi:hypothetical protein
VATKTVDRRKTAEPGCLVEISSAFRIENERIKPFLRLIGKGLTYSDVLLMMEWYKVLPE